MKLKKQFDVLLTELNSEKQLGDDGIYGFTSGNETQKVEIDLRKSVALDSYSDYLETLRFHHSIPVMDSEVDKFIDKLPSDGIICDIGGCWGWHWRKLSAKRPDVRVVIVDFIRENLIHAKDLLGDRIGKNIFLVHGDATELDFSNNVFDACWSVQTTQHIPNIEKVYKEVNRILKVDGVFIDYSLNNASLVRFIYYLFRRDYTIDGVINGSFYLRRANKHNIKLLNKVFNNEVSAEFSEIIFSPDLKFSMSGKENSFLGKIDARLTGKINLLGLLARQQSLRVVKS